MAYCDYCGLSSCYERGGYCATSRRKITTLLERIRPRVLWIHRDGHRWFFVKEPYPQLWSKEWIDVVW